jgi:hypothetical protein
MNVRTTATESIALLVSMLWVYGGTALAVAAIGDGGTISVWAVVAVVGLSYGLARLLQGLDISEGTARLWGVGLSVGFLYLILRIDITGEPSLWQTGWLVDLFSEPGSTLEGHGGDVTEVVLLSAAWVRGVARGSRELTSDGLLGDVSLGLLVVLLAAVFASAADAPGILRWLPVPYMVASLLALALAHLPSVDADRSRPFLGVWMLWTGGSLGVMAGVALLAGLVNPPSLEAVGRALLLAGEGLGLLVAYLLSPLLFGVSWAAQHLVDWLIGGQQPPPRPTEMPSLPQLPQAQESEPSPWVSVLGYVLRSGLVVLALAIALGVLWLAFQRFSRRREDDTEVREEVTSEGSDALSDLRSMLSAALGRLRGRAAVGPPGRDAIGRLYFSMLRRAAAGGLPRPPANTPLEFAPRLEKYFGSPVPGTISQAYAEARYGRRLPSRREIERLRSHWEVDAKRAR